LLAENSLDTIGSSQQGAGAAVSDDTDATWILENSLKSFQQMAGINITGEFLLLDLCFVSLRPRSNYYFFFIMDFIYSFPFL